MSKHKYTDYTKPQVEEPVEETVVVEEEIVVEEEVVETVVPATFAKVVDCKQLRVRKNPNKLADVLCLLPAGSEVKVDLDGSTVGFYKITTEAGVEGYCIKEKIAIV